MIILLLPNILSMTPKCLSDSGGHLIFKAYINAKVT